MKIEEYELGQKVSLYGRIEAIDIANIHNKENTTILSIKTVTGKIHVNPKWEEVTIEPDQPKLEVTKCVADWYEENKDKLEEELCYQIWLIRESGAETDFEYWLTETENPIQTLINMHQFGYTVQKEKLYTVAIPVQNGKVFCLRKTIQDGQITARICSWFSHNIAEPELKNLTETEIKERYDWCWQFAKEVTE